MRQSTCLKPAATSRKTSTSIVGDTMPNRLSAAISASEPATTLVARPTSSAWAWTRRSSSGMAFSTKRDDATVRNGRP